MQRSIVISVLGIVLGLSMNPAYAGSENSAPNLIHVSGQGSVEFTPDRAQFQLGINKSRALVSDAVSAHNSATHNVLQALRRAGVAAIDLKTIGFSVRPEYRAGNLVGYSASSNIQVRTTETGEVGELMSIGITAGATNISGLWFGLVDQDQAVENALANAVADAERKASTLAQAAGMQLGMPVSISTLNNPSSPSGSVNFSPYSAVSSVPIEIGSHQVRATVFVVYGFE